MSYQCKAGIGDVVLCDLCGQFGAIFDRNWREMRRTARGEPLHLCEACRRAAVWCETHQRYHQPDSLHRCSCAVCGGLFTAEVRKQMTCCPSCRRMAAA